MDLVQGIWLPPEFVEILAKYSGKVTLTWALYWDESKLPEDGHPPIAYEPVSDCAAEYLWDVNKLTDMKQEFDQWVASAFPDVTDPWQRSWHDKVPFLTCSNGDLLAFDLSKGLSNCPVVYLSHDGDLGLHGHRLGQNFVDFMTRWSNIGCPGPEFWEIAPFYDQRFKQIRDSGKVVEDWKNWVNDG